jgi:phage-related holin
MVLSWINYLCLVVGSASFIMLVIITAIVLKRCPTEKINWLFASSFFFLAVGYVVLPLGAFVYVQSEPTAMLVLTKIYALSLVIGLTLLMLSSIAFNFGTHFAFRWEILIPSIIAVLTIGGLLFGLTNTESNLWYSMKSGGGESADTQTSYFFMGIFYPICIAMIIVIFNYFSRALKQTQDENIKLSLKYFLTGFSLSISSLIPNILSNALAGLLGENAQLFNSIEFILVGIGMFFMLLGFFVKSKRVDENLANCAPS